MQARGYLILIYIIPVLIISSCGKTNKIRKKDNSPLRSTETTKLKSHLSIGGTYTFGVDVENGPVGSVIIYPQTPTSALFFLDVCRGAPSYNLGQLFGQMTIKNNIGIYDSSTDDDDLKCILRFEFSPGQLIVTTDEKCDECGFGHAVYADNTYKLTDKSLPKYFIDGEGDTIYFKGLTIEKYRHMFE
jgi:hypothetical protein